MADDESPSGALPHPRDPADDAADAASVARGLGRAFRPWILGVLGGAVFLAFLLWGANRPDDPHPLDIGERPADASVSTPADGLDFAELARRVGEGCLELLVADTSEERQSGLRGREGELERVDGMLFVYEQPTGGAFTMSEVVAPLEIGFYGPGGERLGGELMEPCEGSIAECPLYPAPNGFQYAIETAPGHLPEGDLGGECEP